MLEKENLQSLFHFARGLGLHALIEVHSMEEMKSALALKAEFIGVNNRNLNTMKIDLGISKDLAPFHDQTSVLVSESGLNSGSQLHMFSKMGYSAFLMGTHFMKRASPGKELAQLLNDSKLPSTDGKKAK
jgi:indole-3-glycerol phosphate synthase